MVDKITPCHKQLHTKKQSRKVQINFLLAGLDSNYGALSPTPFRHRVVPEMALIW